MQQPEIVEKPELKVVGIHRKFIHALSPDANAMEVIGPLWGAFLGRKDEIRNRVGHDTLYGVIWGEPEDQRSHAHELEYLCCAPVTSFEDVPEGMQTRVVPATTFATVLHEGRIQKIAETVGALYRDWLPSSGFEHSGIADVELYDERFGHGGDDSVMEYWISVRPSSA